jgi:hypothetical protein
LVSMGESSHEEVVLVDGLDGCDAQRGGLPLVRALVARIVRSLPAHGHRRAGVGVGGALRAGVRRLCAGRD